MKYTDLIGGIKDNRKFTGSKEKGKGMGMEEMKKVKTGSIIVLVLSIITIVVMLIGMAAVGLVVSGMAGAAGASGAVIAAVFIIVNANKARKELAVQRGDSGTEDDGAEKMDS